VVAYGLSLALVIVGLVVLLAVLVRAARVVRRFNDARAAADLRLTDALGLLQARRAALGVAIRERSHVRMARVPSGEPVETGGRPWAT
jgi:hypothetical protein